MPLPFAAQLAISAAPSLISAGANWLRGDRKSPYEQKLSSMADVFEEQATAPITENQAYKSGKRELDRTDEERRDRIEASSAITGATDESKLASTEQANEIYSNALGRLLSRAQQYRDQMQSRYLNVLGQQEQAGRSADARFNQKVNSITQPLGQASRAFLFSDIFSGGSSGPGLGPGAAARSSAMADQVRPSVPKPTADILPAEYDFSLN